MTHQLEHARAPYTVTVPEQSAGTDSLVSPPDDEEVYAYLGPQKRWVQVTMACAFILAGISLARFSLHTIWLYPLLIVLAINVTGSILSALSGWNSRIPTARSHRATVTAWHDGRTTFPSVDIFLPTCGEDMSVLLNTYRHVKQVHWSGELRVLVLDDADRDEVRLAAIDFGFDYEVRPDRGHMKKAGNLQNAFRLSNGEFIAIFDADFCPRADYLEHLVPYTDDPAVGIVQSPQYFSTEESMSWLERTAGATQELFYRWVQPSRDRAGAPICVGTCALYRRHALAEVGGFAQIEHSEDVHTGIFLLRGGYRTRYVPILISKGLCPSDLAGFLNQQYRWCNGSITLLQSRVAQRQPLSFRQRMCFWAGFMYYISTAVNVFVLHVPGMVMAIFFADQIKASHFIPFMAGAWVYFVLLPRVSVGRWRFEVMRTQLAYGFCHALAITHKLTGRTRGWVATGAVGKSSSLARTVSKIGCVTLVSTLGISWGAWAFDTYRLGLREFWTMGLFLIGYTYLAVPLIIGFLRVLEILPARSPRPTVFTRLRRNHNRITMFEAVGYTALILFAAVVASGYFDLVIPWS